MFRFLLVASTLNR